MSDASAGRRQQQHAGGLAGGVAGGVDGPPRSARRSAANVAADLTVYAALMGRPPQIDPSLADPVAAARAAVRADPWSPAVLGTYVREVVRAKRVHLNRAEIAAWLRRQSDSARRRLASGRRDRTVPGAFIVSTDVPATQAAVDD